MGVNELSILGMTSLISADIVTTEVTNKVNVLLIQNHFFQAIKQPMTQTGCQREHWHWAR